MEKRYNYKEAEKKIQSFWEQNEIFTMANNPGPIYSIDTPPPTVSGSLHIGHIFSYTQTDIIARYQRLNGYRVYYPFGFDDNGLPTERFVEKKHNISGYSTSRYEFIRLCLKETEIASVKFTKLWRRFGLSVDWDKIYSTMAYMSRKISQESFIRLYNDGFVYRKQEPALYCPTCFTAIAQADLEDQQQETSFNDIMFRTKNGERIIIGTTRPELLPSCVALFYHPDDQRYQHLQGQYAIVPIFGQEVPILPDDMVEIDKGTGLVMCCTFGDKADIYWYKKHNLPYTKSLNKDGRFDISINHLAHLRVPAARKKILDILTEYRLLLAQKQISHTVNIHERCKKQIEYVNLHQWFINILDHKQTFIELADTITWNPAFMKKRYLNWVENLSWNWCISRQRFYGVPFPAWHCRECGCTLLAKIELLPIDPQDGVYNLCPTCNSTELIPDTDVMDTWNTSALTPYLTAHLLDPRETSIFEDERMSEYVPMSIRPQAHDIIRTWAFYTITRTWMHNKTIPWKNIVISGHVLSDQKEKLSKSKNNTKLDPEQLLEQFSADAIRYWTGSATLGYDTSFSEAQLKQGNRLITKLWNAFLFIGQHITPSQDSGMNPEDFSVQNQWILHHVSLSFSHYQAYFAKQEFSHALNEIERFFWHQYCDNYLELIKHQLFNPEAYTPHEIEQTRWTLYTTGLRILQMYAPFVPHVTDTIYQEVYKPFEQKESLHLIRFVDTQTAYLFQDSSDQMDLLLSTIATIRRIKSEYHLSLKTPIAHCIIDVSPEAKLILEKHELILKGLMHIEALSYASITPGTSQLEEKDGLWYASIILTMDNA